MKRFLVTLILCVIGATGLTSANEHHPSQNGEITPYLSLVANVEGKAFFVDTGHGTSLRLRNQTEASAYCSTLGMLLAEINSQIQFDALDQANVDEWPEYWAVWTAGTEFNGIHRYVWKNSGTSIHTNLTYYSANEEIRYGIIFRKQKNSSYLTNRAITGLEGTLCQTLN